MTLCRSSAEREVAFLAYTLRMRRMSDSERAIYFNSLVGKRPSYGLESRLADLTEELRLW